MKKLLFFLLLLPMLSRAQTDTTKVVPHEQYCMVVITGKTFSSKVNVSIDFGQRVKGFSNQELKDENGNAIDFNSTVDALNYMAEKGWLFVSAVFAVNSGTGGALNYIMRKPVPTAK